MDIMNMTLGQILHSLTSNMLVDFAILSGLLNFEAIVRQVAVNKGYKGVVSLCDKVAGAITFALDILEAVGKKQPPKAVPVVLLCVGLMFSSGCASAIMKSGCGHIIGADVTIPYVGGKANGNAYGCYMGCAGASCKAPDYTALATITAAYVTSAAKDNTMTTSGASVITVTPIATK